MRIKIRVLIAARALALCVGFLGGCTPPQVEPPTTTETGGPGTSEGPTTDAPTGSSTTTGDTTTVDPTGSASGEPTGTTSPADCEGPNGCFDCPPTKPIEVLNACTDATCEPFPNTKQRLPLLNDDGTLPPLP